MPECLTRTGGAKRRPQAVRRKGLIIAIDGPAGSGKSSTAKVLAKRMGLPYIDTGAMYRALTLNVMRLGIPFEDKAALIAACKKAHVELRGKDPNKQRVYLNGKNVSGPIRMPEVTKNVFHVAQEALIRKEMVKKQRRLGAQGGAVMEGRDIGTVVFPNADLKFYFVATKAVRARRRHRDFLRAGKKISVQQVLRDIVKRDKTDYTRKEGPLRCAKDAIRLDTSTLTIDQTVDKILEISRR